MNKQIPVLNYLRLLPLVALMVLAGCGKESYPEAKLKESLMEICRQEYGVEKIDVKIEGNTIAVYLPLSKLFATDDFKAAVLTGKIRNLETLFEPSPEALEKVEDVLFSISRVILSTDRKLDFYILQATDVEKTGLQLILTGYVDDIKRVRIWDIPRSEYRKRVIHELRLNHAVMWHKPVRDFFKDLQALTPLQLEKKYFKNQDAQKALQPFLRGFKGIQPGDANIRWDIIDMRSAAVQKNEVLVYTKTKPMNSDGTSVMADGAELEYLFMLHFDDDESQIMRIIPFQFVDGQGQIKKIRFPKEFRIRESLDSWEEEFALKPVNLGEFLAQQLTRRVQALVMMDERIQNTFRDIKLNFEYHDQNNSRFYSLDLEASLRDFNHYTKGSLIYHEDMLYFLNIASQEFVNVLRGYSFGDYNYLSLNVAQEGSPFVLGRENLELFRRKKVDFAGLLTPTKL